MICFVGTYPPIKCGIADYSRFIVRSGTDTKWGVISFFPGDGAENPGIVPGRDGEPVWYGIPAPEMLSASVIRTGLKEIDCLQDNNVVLWFQHEFNIWRDNQALINTLKGLDLPKVVTLHTMHFQSKETPSGLCLREYELLWDILPHVDAVTVFSQGVFSAVVDAFPEYRRKICIIKHGVQSYPAVGRLTRWEAREAFNDYLLLESELEPDIKGELLKQHVFLDPGTVVIGQTGFLHPMKGSEYLFPARDRLQELVPDRRVIAIRVGRARLDDYIPHANELRRLHNGVDKFLLDLWLPDSILPLAQRAFDINYYWPGDCTQSGVLSHAIGARAIIAGRDLEGVGETLKQAGAICDTNPEQLLLSMRDIILNPELGERMEDNVAGYAVEYSWERQARRHSMLARSIMPTSPVRAITNALGTVARVSTSLTRWGRGN